jgi:hypothetical protein
MPRLANIGGELLVDVLRKIQNGTVRAPICSHWVMETKPQTHVNIF